MGVVLPNGRDMAFLSYSGKASDFIIGDVYQVRIVYIVTYPRKPDAAGKDWAGFQVHSYEAAIAHPEFVKYNLLEGRIVPYFEIQRP